RASAARRMLVLSHWHEEILPFNWAITAAFQTLRIRLPVGGPASLPLRGVDEGPSPSVRPAHRELEADLFLQAGRHLGSGAGGGEGRERGRGRPRRVDEVLVLDVDREARARPRDLGHLDREGAGVALATDRGRVNGVRAREHQFSEKSHEYLR